jgi:hypothetical protein
MGAVDLPQDVGPEVSDAVLSVLADAEFSVFCPKGREEEDAYQHVVRGRCMLCGNDLREETVILVTSSGIVGVWCDGECMTDMNVIGWLSDLLSDMTSKYLREE